MAEEGKEVELPFKVRDEASGPLARIAEHAEHLGHHVDHAIHKFTELGGAILGIAGGFGLERMVETGKDYLEQVAKMSKLTGTSAQNVAALRDVFERSDVSADQLSMTMTSLSKKSAMLQEGGSVLMKQAQQWGIDMKHGPEATLVSMSKLVEQHKIGAGQVSQLTRASGDNLGAMMGLLQRGPKELSKALEDARKRNAFLNDETVEGFEKFKAASISIHQSWTRLSAKVVSALAPALERLAQKLSSWMDAAGGGAEKFAQTIAHGLEFAVEHAKTLGKILLANSILMRTQGFGVVGGIGRLASRGFGLGGRLVGGVGGLLGRGYAASGMQAGLLGRTLGGFSSVLGPIGTIVGWFLKLATSAAGITLVVGGIAAITSNLGAIKERLSGMFEKIRGGISHVVSSIGHLLSEDSPIGRFLHKVGSGLLWVVDKLGSGLARVLDFIGEIIDAVDRFTSGKSGDQLLYEREQKKYEQTVRKFQTGEMGMKVADLVASMKHGERVTEEQRRFFEKYAEARKEYGVTTDAMFDRLKKRYGAAPGESAAPAMGLYQDFRGSRFEISQAFSEGFDPDRVAVAFANDLGSLGERKLQSGFSPLFGVR